MDMHLLQNEKKSCGYVLDFNEAAVRNKILILILRRKLAYFARIVVEQIKHVHLLL